MKFRDIKASNLFTTLEYKHTSMDMCGFAHVNNQNQVTPEGDIVTFYLAAHLLGVAEDAIGNRVMGSSEEEYCQTLLDDMEQIFKRMFTYIMLISIGETRHGSTSDKMDEIKLRFGIDVAQFACNVYHTTSRDATRSKFLDRPRNINNFMDYCKWCFIECFSGGSYGGPKWRDISEKCIQVLKGEASPYTMVDVSWAMVHNTGSIFNKSTIYTPASTMSGLIQFLDLQRAGAIPAFIMNRGEYKLAGLDCHTSHLAKHVHMIEVAELLFGVSGIGDYISCDDIGKAGALSSFFKSKADHQTAAKEVEKISEATLVITDQSFVLGGDEFTVLEREQ